MFGRLLGLVVLILIASAVGSAATLTLLRYRSGYRQAMAFWTDVCPSLHVVRYGERVRVEAVEVFRRYGRDHRLSFCDALSFVVVSTLLEQMPCLSFDRDFRRLGLSVMP